MSFSVFFEDRVGVRALRNRYSPLTCSVCGKFDEYAALDRGVEDGVRIRGKRDVQLSDDFCVCVGPRFVEAWQDLQLSGLRFVEIPKSAYHVIRPERIVSLDIALSQMQLVGQPCGKCGRYEETCFQPSLKSGVLPTDRKVAFSTDVRTEKSYTRMSQIYLPEEVVAEFKRQKITGIDWVSMSRKAQ